MKALTAAVCTVVLSFSLGLIVSNRLHTCSDKGVGLEIIHEDYPDESEIVILETAEEVTVYKVYVSAYGFRIPEGK